MLKAISKEPQVDYLKNGLTLGAYICHWILGCITVSTILFIYFFDMLARSVPESAAWTIVGFYVYGFLVTVPTATLSIARQFYGIEWRLLTLLILAMISWVLSFFEISYASRGSINDHEIALVIYAIFALGFTSWFFITRALAELTQRRRDIVSLGVFGNFSLLAAFIVGSSTIVGGVTIIHLDIVLPVIFFSAVLLTIMRQLWGIDWRSLTSLALALALLPAWLISIYVGGQKALPEWYLLVTLIAAAVIWALSLSLIFKR